MSENEQKETEYVAGAIEGITQKGADKWQVVVKPNDSQYTKNLWTKNSELVTALSQKIGQNSGFVCGVSHWTNNDGKAVRSLWIDREAEMPEPGGLPQATSTVSGNQQTMPATTGYVAPVTPPVDWDAKERRDYRSRAWAQTLGAFTHTIKVDEDPVEVFQRLQPFQRKVFTDVCQSFAFPATDADENIPF